VQLAPELPIDRYTRRCPQSPRFPAIRGRYDLYPADIAKINQNDQESRRESKRMNQLPYVSPGRSSLGLRSPHDFTIDHK
jgi:hypothetical protein